MDWETITPNEAGDWINQRDPRYATWQPLGGKGVVDGVFRMGSNGLKTNRDVWVYSYSLPQLSQRVSAMVDYYNAQAQAGAEPEFLDPTLFSWNDDDKKNVRQGRTYRFDAGRLYTSVYRPFVKQHVCFDRQLNNRVYRLYECFPTPAHDNVGFYIVGSGSDVPFSALVTDLVPNLHVTGAGSGGQFFPRWTWEKVSGRHAAEDGGFNLDGLTEAPGGAGSAIGSEGEVVGDYRRVDNITDATLRDYRAAYGPQVEKADVFYYVYGLLHSPDYRSRYGADLKKSLPRIPLVTSRADFVAIATAGRGLADLHLDYETAEPWELTLTVDGKEVPWAERDAIDLALLHVTKLRYGKTRVDGKPVADKTSIVYNEHVTVSGIPEAAQDYLLGSRSALDWLLDRYQVKTDKASGIVNDPNEWMAEGAGQGEMAGPQPRYLLDLIARVTTVSVRTQQIVNSLPPLDVRD